MRFYLFICATMCQLLAAQLALADSAVSFNQAAKDYRDGKYQVALIEFEKYRSKDPNNLLVHYYEALCFQGLNELERARQEFDFVAQNDTGDLKNKAELGLKRLANAKTLADKSSRNSDSGVPTLATPVKELREGHLYTAIEYLDVNMCPKCKAFAEAFWQAELKLKSLRTVKINIETGDPSIALYKVGKRHPYMVLLDGVGKVLFQGEVAPDPKVIYNTFQRFE